MTPRTTASQNPQIFHRLWKSNPERSLSTAGVQQRLGGSYSTAKPVRKPLFDPLNEVPSPPSSRREGMALPDTSRSAAGS